MARSTAKCGSAAMARTVTNGITQTVRFCMARTKHSKMQPQSLSKNSLTRSKPMRKCKKRPQKVRIALKTTSRRPTTWVRRTRRPGNSLMSPKQITTASNAARHRRVGPQKSLLLERLHPKTLPKKQLPQQRQQQHRRQHRKRSSRPLLELILTNKPLRGQSHSCPLLQE